MGGKGSNSGSASNQEGNDVARSMLTLRQQIRSDWKDLWDQRIEDKLIAENIASKNYDLLFVERGVIIKATKDYRPPSLAEIMEMNEALLGASLTYPNPDIGGWGKFSKEVLSKQVRSRKISERRPDLYKDRLRNGPRKKGGRGWLHR